MPAKRKAAFTARFHQSRTPATLHDTLLAKLPGGELSVTKAVISSATE